MKLLQIGPYPPPLGGWSFHIKVFKDYLDSAGIENEVLDVGENRTVKGRTCIDIQGPFDYFFKVFRFCWKKYLIYIHCNGNAVTGLVLTVVAQIIALLMLKRCLISFHAGVLQKCFMKQISQQKILAYISFHLARGIICNSEEVKEQILKFGLVVERVHAIPCFSEQYIQHERKLTKEEQHFIEKHVPIFSSYIFFREEYDPDTLIDAVKIIHKKHPIVGVVIIGSLDGVDRYRLKIQQYGLQDNILLVGEKCHDGFLSIVAASDLVIRTPVSDGVCSSVMEALALKVPVIASDNGTRPNNVVLYEPGSARDLSSKCLESLCNIEELRRRLSGVVRRDAIREEFELLSSYAKKSS